jgi:DNA mismatch repair protein MutS
MRQYFTIKQQYPHVLLLFQVGDFYELFFDDAKKASAFLGIALTKRGKVNGDPIPLCGVPVHALDHYVAKLIKGGFKVALCDQLEEPKPGKVVERGVTQVLTPGTLTDSKLLDDKSASYLFTFFPSNDQWGLLFAELLTAQLFATVLPANGHKALESELIRFFPDEIIIPDMAQAKEFETLFKKLGYCTTPISPAEHSESAQQWIQNQFSADAQSPLTMHASLRLAMYHFYSYIRQTQQTAAEQFKTIHWYEPDDFLILDSATQTNLELLRNAHDGSRKHTLFEVMDGACTPMGSRMIKKWIMRPLVKHHAIVQRQEVIAQWMSNILAMQQFESIIADVGDFERVIGRIALRRATVHDFLHLKRVLELVPSIVEALAALPQTYLLHAICASIADFSGLHQLLEAALNTDSQKNYIIKEGFDQQLDDVRELAEHGTQKIMALEAQEQQATGINSLKIRYNTVHGYYIEVTNTHKDSIPDRYMRQQTLVGRERYMTAELQQLQHEIVRAQSEMALIEKAVFERVKNEVIQHISSLRKMSHALANCDALLGLARVAYQHGYTCPTFNDQRIITITGGRHPVVERILGHSFIPNNTQLTDAESTWIITGPNMGGKSTYLRQVALINIMAQIGSFVPAENAQVPILDRIFTRIGAGDNLSQGKSTFLVEMEETAAICSQATDKSLVILDEVGRGTSTFDGLAIAQAVVEYIHTQVKARCLFATHYHELTLLPHSFKGIASYYAACKKTHQGIQFLYKILPGVADGSFGVEVAKLAQLPKPVIARAQELLQSLEHHSQQVTYGAAQVPHADTSYQLKKQVEELQRELHTHEKMKAALVQIDYDNLSPKAAFDLLWKMRELR